MILMVNGKLVNVEKMFRIEVNNKRELEAVQNYAEVNGKVFKKGKPHGKPGQYRVDCYVSADYYDLREKVRDTLSRMLGHDVGVYVAHDVEAV